MSPRRNYRGTTPRQLFRLQALPKTPPAFLKVTIAPPSHHRRSRSKTPSSSPVVSLLCASVKSLCLCGESCLENLTTETLSTHRDTEVRNVGTLPQPKQVASANRH